MIFHFLFSNYHQNMSSKTSVIVYNLQTIACESLENKYKRIPTQINLSQTKK